MQDIRVIRKLEFAVGELRKISIDYRKTVDNKFIELFFEKLQTERLNTLERLVTKGTDDQTRDYWAGYAQALQGIEKMYDKFAEELDKELKAG